MKSVEEQRAALKAQQSLDWIDEFVARIKPYVFVRVEDHVLIKRPNMACKLNAIGARVLKALLDGRRVAEVHQAVGGTADQAREIAQFLWAVKEHLDGSLTEFTDNPAVEVKPFDLRFTAFPVLSEVALTDACTVRCKFCYAGCGGRAPSRHGGTMTSEQIRLVLWKLYHQAKVPSVSFTGGEPTMVPELPLYVQYAKELGMRVNLITNGTLVTHELARRLAHSGLDSAQVSIEGVTATTHDSLVGSVGAFAKSVAAVRILNDADIRTHSNTTLTRHNIDEAGALPQFAKDTLHTPRFSMNLMMPAGSGTDDGAGLVRYTDTGAVIERVIAESAQCGVEFMWYSPLPMCLFNTIAHGLGNKGCSACDGLISIAANGDVLPCSSCNDPVGNLVHEEFDAIWHRPAARAYRDKTRAPRPCADCADFYLCHGACFLYWHHVGTNELN